MEDAVKQLRRLLLVHGMPEESNLTHTQRQHPGANPQIPSLRGRVWSAFLGVKEVSVSKYRLLVAKGESVSAEAIANDALRTFRGEHDPRSHGHDPKCVSRLLNAYMHRQREISNPPKRYLQGLNLIAGAFLCVMPEAAAFWCFCKCMDLCPRYLLPSIDGVHDGCRLFDHLLHRLDPPLAAHLDRKQLCGVLFALAPIKSMMCSMPPLTEALKLMDYMLGFGLHLNVVFCCAYFVLHRDAIMATDTPMALISARKPKWPLNAKAVIGLGIKLLDRLSDPVLRLLIAHTTVSVVHTHPDHPDPDSDPDPNPNPAPNLIDQPTGRRSYSDQPLRNPSLAFGVGLDTTDDEEELIDIPWGDGKCYKDIPWGEKEDSEGVHRQIYGQMERRDSLDLPDPPSITLT